MEDSLCKYDSLSFPESLTLDRNYEHSTFHQQKFEKERRRSLKEIKFLLGIPELFNKLKPGEVYTIILSQETAQEIDSGSAVIVQKGKGVYGAIVKHRESGKIVEQVKLKKLSPDLLNALKVMGTQILMIEISLQLREIQNKLNYIIQGAHDDRIADIEAGVGLLDQALSVNDPSTQKHIIINAIQNLQSGLTKSQKSLEREIEALPDPSIRFWDNWFTSKTKEAQQKIRFAEETFFACLKGIKAISECYAILGEPMTAERTLSKWIGKVSEAGIKQVSEKARLVPIENDYFPELPWRQFIEAEKNILGKLSQCILLENLNTTKIELEFKPEELKEVYHGFM